MNFFVIIPDSTCDLSQEFLTENKIEVMQLSFLLDNTLYDQIDTVIDLHTFYTKMRSGSTPVTQQVNPENAFTCFEKYAKQGIDILCINLSSKLSGTYHSTCMAKQDIMEQYPDIKVHVVDTLSASMGEGILVHHANQMKKDGKNIEEIAHWLKQNAPKTCHFITVDDLNHLQRGGRLSKGSAIIGGILGIKPILRIDESGCVVPLDKVRGRKQSLAYIVDLVKEQAKLKNICVLAVAHADSLEDANTLVNMIKPIVPDATILLNFVGPTVGTHVGPGALGVFFVGENR
ncbi:MAG: DegV family protein [Oscillospiraceae bacterium]